MSSRSVTKVGLIAVVFLLAAVLVVLLWNLASLLGVRSSGRAESLPTRRGVISDVSLPDAYARAQTRAHEWAQDAYLVRAEASWYLEGEWAGTGSPQVAWSLSYFSPATHSLAAVTICDDATLWVAPFEIPVVPTSLGDGLPTHGVETAWLSFRAAGGESFLASHPNAQVTFRLQQAEGRSVWAVSAFADGEFVRVELDAQSGIVLTPDA